MCLIKTTTMVKEVKHSFILPIVFLMYVLTNMNIDA